jgi:protein-tyrosine phosphatase
LPTQKKNGVDLSTLRARQFNSSDFDYFDYIFVMDTNNLKNVVALAKSQTHKQKVSLFLNTLYPDLHMEVPDPYYHDEQKFEEVFQLVYKACNNLILNLAK